jgi:hypothetical protein
MASDRKQVISVSSLLSTSIDGFLDKEIILFDIAFNSEHIHYNTYINRDEYLNTLKEDDR